MQKVMAFISGALPRKAAPGWPTTGFICVLVALAGSAVSHTRSSAQMPQSVEAQVIPPGTIFRLPDSPAVPSSPSQPARPPLPTTPDAGPSNQIGRCQSSGGNDAFTMHGAVSPTHIVAVETTGVTTGFQYLHRRPRPCFDNNETRTGLNEFFSIVRPVTEQVSRARVIYDPGAGRFFIAAKGDSNMGTKDQSLLLAVSTDATGQSWFLSRTVLSEGSTKFCKKAVDSFWDSLTIGYSSSRLFVASDDISAGSGATNGAILSIDKVPMQNGQAFGLKCFFNLSGRGYAPPIVKDSSSAAFFLTVGSSSGSSVSRDRLDASPSGSASDTLTSTTAIAVPAWTAPPDASQPNGMPIDTLDGGFRSPTVQIGTSLWNLHTVDIGGFARWRLYKLSTTGTSPLATINPTSTGNDHLFNASVDVHAADSPAFVTASRTVPSASGPAGNNAILMFSGPNSSSSGWIFDVIFSGGVAGQSLACPTPCRWADVSSTQIDPANTAHAYGFNIQGQGTVAPNGFLGRISIVTYVAPPAPVPLACTHLSPLRDFNADGRADMLFRNGVGQVALYLMNGPQIMSGQIIGAVGAEWVLVGIGDFNGDGRADFVMRRADGMIAIYLLDGTRIYDARLIGAVGPDWRVVGVGDFNGDGKADFLMHRPDGMLAVYLMNGFQFVAAQVIGQIGSEWKLIGVADLNGDGKADFMARRGDGALAVYLMNGLSIQSGAVVGAVGNEWVPVALADFNADARGDLLMRRGDGSLAMYLMSNGQIYDARIIGGVGTEWSFVGSGDFNGDGRADFLMRRADGSLAQYLISGFQILSGQIIGQLGTDWESCYGQGN